MSTTDTTTQDLAQTILLAIATLDELPRYGDRKVFIGPLHAFVCEAWGPLPRPAFDRLLLDANRQGLLTLARADYVAAMDPALVAASLIEDLGAEFHFVLDPHVR